MNFLLNVIKVNYHKARNLKNFLSYNSGDAVEIKGWASKIRKQKNISFINLNDGSKQESIQIVVKTCDIDSLTIGSFIHVFGNVRKKNAIESNYNSQIKGVEIIADSVIFNNKYQTQTSDSYTSLEIDNEKYRSEEGILIRHQLSTFGSIFRIRAQIKAIFEKTLTSLGYLLVDTPILTSINCEETENIFSIEKINGLKLTGSAQMHLEILCQGLGQVFSTNHTFRAEPSHTRFHLAEFRMIEAESIHLTSVDELNFEIETIFKKVLSQYLEFSHDNYGDISNVFRLKNEASISNWLKQIERISDIEYPRIKYKDLDKYLGDKWNLSNGLPKEAELFLVSKLNSPVFITHFPKTHKPAYCKLNGNESLSTDLLFPEIGEIVGGSVRVGSELKAENFPNWYVKIRETNTYGGSGGFGIGFERILQYLLGLSHIKDSCPFPRVMNKFYY